MTTYAEYDWNPYNLPHDVLAAIGLATACFAQSEELLQHAIAGCGGLDVELGVAFTAHMSMPLRFDVLRAAAEIRVDSLDDLDELDTLIADFEDAIKRRNRIAHNRWCIGEDGKTYTSNYTARGTVVANLAPAPVEQIVADAQFIYDVGFRLFNFIKSIGLMPPILDRPSRAHKSKAARKERRNKRL